MCVALRLTETYDACVSQAGGIQYPYVRVAGLIRQLIDDGELRPGDQVPSVTQISEQYEVSRSTARRALDLLKEWGLTEALPGLGTFVKGTPT